MSGDKNNQLSTDNSTQLDGNVCDAAPLRSRGSQHSSQRSDIVHSISQNGSPKKEGPSILDSAAHQLQSNRDVITLEPVGDSNLCCKSPLKPTPNSSPCKTPPNSPLKLNPGLINSCPHIQEPTGDESPVHCHTANNGLKSGRPQLSNITLHPFGSREERSSLSEDSSDNFMVSHSGSESREDDSQYHFQRPKSVSFHTRSSLPLESKISSAIDCVKYMIDGTSLIKVRPSARQYRRFFRLENSCDEFSLKWMPSSKKSSKAKILVKSMKEVRLGKTTEVLRSKEICWNYSEDCAFSIIYNDTFESLDLIASSPDEANIWVTGLNLLINAAKSPDSLDDTQKMREKWLCKAFDQADTDQKGILSEGDAISLMKRINSALSTNRLHQKFMEFGHGKQVEERGQIDRSGFVNMFTETTRKEINFLLIRFSGKNYLTLEDLQLFLEGEQGMFNVTTDDCLKIIEQFEPSEEAKRSNQLLIDGFTLFLLSENCDILDPIHRNVCQDMSHPLPHYFISTSHNTYLLEDQLKGPSSIEGYSTALKMGCRCIKVDCWDSANGPVVFHGNTLTSKIPLEDVLETIEEFAFVTSPYPLVIHLENHCTLENQQIVCDLFRKVLGKYLHVPSEVSGQMKASQITPELLKGKIIIKGKKVSPSCTELTDDVSDEDEDQEGMNCKSMFKKIKLHRSLSNLITLTRMRFWDVEFNDEIQKLSDVSSFSESMASKLSQFSAEDIINHNKRFLTHIFPNSNRVDSSNFNPLEYWCLGCQLVAMNYQTSGLMMDLYQGWYQQNGNCGYTLKPQFLRDNLFLYSGGCSKDPLPGTEPTILSLKIISAQQLPQPKGASAKASSIDPYVVAQIYGSGVDCAEARTRTHEGHSPIFDETFEFTITVPEMAILRIAVLDDEFINDDFIGQYSVPVLCLRKGYRHMKLLSNNGDPLYNTTLFVYISMTTRSEKQRTKRKKAWLNMKCIGIKTADDLFKNAANHLAEAHKMRVDEEQAMLELCKECGVLDNANIVQCMRVFSLRMASCPTVTSWDIENITTQPGIKVCGELTPCLSRTVSLLEKVLIEYHYIKRSAQETLKVLTDLYKTGEGTWGEIIQNSSTFGLKGRKGEKVVENFFWNMTVLATQTSLLKCVYDQSCTVLHQLKTMMPVFTKLFQRERESVLTASTVSTTAPVTPVLSNQLMPANCEAPPLTPTSPGDGRLRGILKKTGSLMLHPQVPKQDSNVNVFFGAGENDDGGR